MKKLISVLLVLALCCALVPAMAEEDVTGEWYASYYGMVVTLKLNADGTASMEVVGMEEASETTWAMEGETVTVTVEGNPMTGAVADGVMNLKGEDGTELAFTREPIEAFVPAEVNAEAAAEDFNGEWKYAYANMEGAYMAYPDDYAESLVIDNGSVTFIGGEDSSMIFLFGADPVAMTYEGGALVYAIDIPNDEVPMQLSLKAEMLQDGMMALTVDMGYGASVLYLTKTAAEEPAA